MQPSRLLWSAYLAYHLRGQARFPFKPLAAIQRVQGRRVRSMVSHAYRTVPYYRETMTRLGLGLDDFRTIDDLTKLPVIEREQLQRDPEYFVSTAQPLDRYLKLQSGGSSGRPCTVYHDTAAIFQNAAHAERERSMLIALVGRSFGYRETVFASSLGTDRRVQEFSRRRGFFPAGMQIHRQYLSLMDAPEKNVPLLNTFQPDVIHGFGSYLEILFSYLRATGQSFHRPQAITYSSDGMSNATRRFIKETLGVPIVSTYEAIEAFKIGFECLHGRGLHLNIDLYPVRVVNARGESLPDEENGDVVVSNLVNRATVLLNYRLGDLSRLLPESCPCGRSLPLLAFPQGRSDDWIHLPSGQVMHPQPVVDILEDIETIWQFQIVQESDGHFRVSVVAAPTCDREAITKRVSSDFQQKLGDNITVDLTFVDHIERTAGGKLRPIISNLYGRNQPAS
jgi:phenylacetate-coenzyme A ligase PaaK-like adenylate-forming protein